MSALAKAVLELAEDAQERGSGLEPDGRLLRRADRLYKLSYWLGLPWRCKIRHAAPVKREHWNEDVNFVEEAWFECPRCEHWFGHASGTWKRG